MFIASSYMLYSPSPGTGLGGSGPLGAGNFPVSAFAAPVQSISPFCNGQSRRNGQPSPVHFSCSPEVESATAESAPTVRTVGFSVSDILEQRSAVPKTAACVVVSRLRTPSIASSDTRSLSPASPTPPIQIRPHDDDHCGLPSVRRSPPVSPPRLKFGMDRILSNDNSLLKGKCSIFFSNVTGRHFFKNYLYKIFLLEHLKHARWRQY